jgi:hypothetical protein
MNQQHFQFHGRGKGTGHPEQAARHIRCADGTVMLISFPCHGIEFVLGYCRQATIDRWGVCIHDPFRRASDTGFTRSWAEPFAKSICLFRPIRLEIQREQDWMRSGGASTA